MQFAASHRNLNFASHHLLAKWAPLGLLRDNFTTHCWFCLAFHLSDRLRRRCPASTRPLCMRCPWSRHPDTFVWDRLCEAASPKSTR
ncbi:hypothetical protein LIA77_06397 [Sarocladium implicatum]|nr:hypothetical protein LIA77_06397 [Sarocladium implicatum]